MRKASVAKIALPWNLNFFAMALLFLAALCFFVVLFCRTEPSLNVDPFNLPWFGEYYPDLLKLKPRFAFFHSREFFTVPGATYLYPAPNAVIYKLFFLVSGSHPIKWFFGLCLSAYAFAGALYSRALMRRGVPLPEGAAFTIFTLLCCYPIWFELKQANIEIVTWILISSGIALFVSGRSYGAAICFCLAGSMKVYPLIFLGLLLERKQGRQILAGLATFGLVTLVSTWLLCPDFTYSWRRVQTGVDLFREQYMLRYRYETAMDHSLFATAKSFWHPLPAAPTLAPVLTAYVALSAMAGIVLWFTRIRRQPVFNQILALTIASILLPPTSFVYTLQHLLAPLALFTLLLVDAARLGIRLPQSKAYLTGFLLLLAPIPEFINRGARLDGRMKSLLLLFLFVLSLLKSVSLGTPTNSTETSTGGWWEFSSTVPHPRSDALAGETLSGNIASASTQRT